MWKWRSIHRYLTFKIVYVLQILETFYVLFSIFMWRDSNTPDRRAMSKSQVKEANVTPPVKGILRHLKWEHLVAGVSGGAASTLLLHPLDLVKIRFQGKKKMLLRTPNKYPSQAWSYFQHAWNRNSDHDHNRLMIICHSCLCFHRCIFIILYIFILMNLSTLFWEVDRHSLHPLKTIMPAHFAKERRIWVDQQV